MEIPLERIKKNLPVEHAVDFWAALEMLTVDARAGRAPRRLNWDERREIRARFNLARKGKRRRQTYDRLAPGGKDLAKAAPMRRAAKSRHGLARSIPTIVLEAMRPDVWHTWRPLAAELGLNPHCVNRALQQMTGAGYVEQQIRLRDPFEGRHVPTQRAPRGFQGAPRVGWYRLTEKGAQARLEGRPEAKRLPPWMVKLQACMKTPRIYRGDYGACGVLDVDGRPSVS